MMIQIVQPIYRLYKDVTKFYNCNSRTQELKCSPIVWVHSRDSYLSKIDCPLKRRGIKDMTFVIIYNRKYVKITKSRSGAEVPRVFFLTHHKENYI